jgi:hypothetical protein
MSTPDQPNVGNDLVRIHRAVTRAIATAAQSSQGAGPQPDLRQGYSLYLRALTSLLHAHHLGEDEIAFPLWQTKDPAAHIDWLKEDHLKITSLLERIDAWNALGAAAWESAALAELHAVLTDLDELWMGHIELEEGTMGPERSAALLTPEENALLRSQLAAHGQQHALPNELVMPFVFYNMIPADRAEFAQLLPPVVAQQLIPVAWKPVWSPMQPFLLE